MGKISELSKKNFTDHELWKSVMAKYLYAKRHRDPKLAIWRKAEDYLYGNHWKNNRMAKYKSKIVDNSVFEAIETTLPVATAISPKAEVFPKPKSYHTPEIIQAAMDYARGLQKEFNEIWKVNRMNRKIRENWRTLKTYGNGIVKAVKVPGKQEIEVSLLDIFQCLPDPFAGSIVECKDSFFIEIAIMYCSDVKKKWGVDVKPEGELDEYRAFNFKDQADDEEGDGTLTPIHDTANEREDILEGRPGGKPSVDGQCIIIECWYADDTEVFESVTVGENEETTGTEPIGYGDKEKYPDGRHTIIAHGEKNLICLDEPNPYERPPYFDTKNYSESSSFWGRPEYKQVERLIKANNMILSQTTDNIRLTGNPKPIVSRRGRVAAKELNNKPGDGITARDTNDVKWMEPPRLNMGDVVGFLNHLNDRKDNILGVQDPSRGKARPGDSGRKVEALQVKSEGRVQPAVDDMSEMLVEMTEHWLYIIRNMFDEEKYHRHQDENGQVNYQKFLGVALNTPQPGQTFQETGDIYPSADMEFEVKLSIGDYLTYNKEAEFEELAALSKYLVEGTPAEILDMMVDAAPNIRDKARLKELFKSLSQGGQMDPELEEMLGSDDPDQVLAALLQNPEANPEVMALLQEEAGQPQA